MIDSAVRATRLAPPRLGPRVLRRARLEDAIAAGREGRLTLVSAGAGFGKTTLVASAVEGLDEPLAWVTCDAGTNSPAALGRHVLAAVARSVPGFGAGTDTGDDPEAVVTAIVNEIALVGPERLVMVLDDVHTLSDDAAAIPLDLARHLPEGVHLILISRQRPNGSLSRLRLSGLSEIGAAELVLRPEEVADVLRLQGLDPGGAAEVHRRTEGWPAAVALLARDQDGSDASVATPAPLMEYLADEIEGLVGADGLRVLEATALCGRVTERMAEAALGSAADGGVLGTLAEASVLVVPLEDPGGGYRYHALLGEFLRARADALGPEERRGLHLRTAEALVAEGEVREAVPHLLEAEAFARAADLIVPIADELAGREPAVLQEWLDALPGGMVDERPALIAASAILLFGARRYEEAFDRMYLAMSRFAARGEAEPAATTLFRLLELLEVACEFGRAVEVCESVLPTLDAGNGLAAAAVRLRLASSLGNLGRIDEAEAIVREIEGSAVAESAPVLHTYAQFVRAWAVEHPRGRSRDAIATMTRVADTLEADPAGDFLRLLPWVYALRSIVCHALEETGAMKADGDRFAELAFRYEIDIAARDIVTRIAIFQALVDGRLDEMDELVARWDAHYVAWRDINWNCLYSPWSRSSTFNAGVSPRP